MVTSDGLGHGLRKCLALRPADRGARRVALGPVDPHTARELLLQHGLVEQDIAERLPFLQHNRRVLKEIEELAAKQRRSDWIVAQHTIHQYYSSRVPEEAYDLRRLKQWLHQQGPDALCMTQQDLLPEADDQSADTQYPDTLAVQKMSFPLQYRYAPGDQQDGVTVTVPKHAINQVTAEQLDWLVPGRLEEKITALIRSLPKSIRRNLVPAPDTAREAARRLQFGSGPLLPTLAQILQQISGETVPADAFQLHKLPAHLRMKVRVVDDDGSTLGVDDSLEELRREFGADQQGATGQIEDRSWDRPPVTDWAFGDLPAEVTVTRGGLRVLAYPAVLDQQTQVVVRLLDTADRAEQMSCAGIRRLYFLAEQKSLQAHVDWLPKIKETQLLASTLLSARDLQQQLALLIADRAFLADEPLPREESSYRQRIVEAAERASVAVQQIAPLIHPMFQAYHQVRLELEDLPPARYQEALADVRHQLAGLLPADFLSTTPWRWLEHFPRYLAAISYRLDKLRHGGQSRDAQALQQLAPLLQQHLSRAESHRQRGLVDPELEQYRWMLEEFRVSLFAQQLGTSLTVSQRRLEKQWAKVQA